MISTQTVQLHSSPQALSGSSMTSKYWPDPDQSRGFELSPPLKRLGLHGFTLRCWEAQFNGLAYQTYSSQIQNHIEKCMDTHRDLSGGPKARHTCCMVGTREDKIRPAIAIHSCDKTHCSTAKSMIWRSDEWQDFHRDNPLFLLLTAGKAPTRLAAVGRDVNSDVYSHDLRKGFIGSRIHFSTSDLIAVHHRGIATLGGIIFIDDEGFALTVSHPLSGIPEVEEDLSPQASEESFVELFSINDEDFSGSVSPQDKELQDFLVGSDTAETRDNTVPFLEPSHSPSMEPSSSSSIPRYTSEKLEVGMLSQQLSPQSLSLHESAMQSEQPQRASLGMSATPYLPECLRCRTLKTKCRGVAPEACPECLEAGTPCNYESFEEKSTVSREETNSPRLKDHRYQGRNDIHIGSIAYRSSVEPDIHDYDWSMCRIRPELLDYVKTNNLVNSISMRSSTYSGKFVVSHAAALPDNYVPISIVTWSENPLEGFLSPTPSFYRMPGSTRFLRVLTVHLERSLELGDCGAWVVDSKNGSWYGHVIAEEPGAHRAYVVPSSDILQDISRQTNVPLSRINFQPHMVKLSFKNEPNLPQSFVRSNFSGKSSLKMPEYTHKPLAPGYIRLLKLLPGTEKEQISCELVTRKLLDYNPKNGRATGVSGSFSVDDKLMGSIEEHYEYFAVSYTWGGPFQTTSNLVVYDGCKEDSVGHSFPLRPNLESALRVFRRSLSTFKTGYFWVDAICIDLTSDEEKSRQVIMTQHIFNGARSVLIWLGDATLESDVAIDFANELTRRGLSVWDDEAFMRQNLPRLITFRDILGREWFSRLWVIQELALARDATVHCGNRTLSWQTLTEVISLMRDSGAVHKAAAPYDHPHIFGDADLRGAHRLMELSKSLVRKSDKGDVIEWMISLEDLVSSLTMFEAVIPHDKIYALLGVSSDVSHLSRGAVHSETESYFVPKVPAISRDEKPSEDHRPAAGKMPSSQAAMASRSDESDSLASNIINVDYNKSFYEAAVDFVRFCIGRDGSLDIICRQWAPEVDGLPSWIRRVHSSTNSPQLRARTSNYITSGSLVGVSQDRTGKYRASGNAKAYLGQSRPSGPIEDRVLMARGFILDTVNEVGQRATNGVLPASWLDLCGWDKETKTAPEKLWRTLIANRGADGLISPNYYGRACSWLFAQGPQGHDLDTRRLLRDPDLPTICREFILRLQAVIEDRCLSFTKGDWTNDDSPEAERLLALLPPDTAPGDLVCILHGCSVPVVLRRVRPRSRWPSHPALSELQRIPSSSSQQSQAPSIIMTKTQVDLDFRPQNEQFLSDNPETPSNSTDSGLPTDGAEYILIGECYVHCMMEGEALTHTDRSGLSIRDFKLV